MIYVKYSANISTIAPLLWNLHQETQGLNSRNTRNYILFTCYNLWNGLYKALIFFLLVGITEKYIHSDSLCSVCIHGINLMWAIQLCLALQVWALLTHKTKAASHLVNEPGYWTRPLDWNPSAHVLFAFKMKSQKCRDDCILLGNNFVFGSYTERFTIWWPWWLKNYIVLTSINNLNINNNTLNHILLSVRLSCFLMNSE